MNRMAPSYSTRVRPCKVWREQARRVVKAGHGSAEGVTGEKIFLVVRARESSDSTRLENKIQAESFAS